MTTQAIAEYYCERCGSAVEVDVGRARRGSKPGGGILTKLRGGGPSDVAYELTVGGTFMLCFGCRQYVCAHCWNEAESRCRTCSPAGDGSDALPATLPHEVPAAEMAEAPPSEPPGPWPASDLKLRVPAPGPAGIEPESTQAEPEPSELEFFEPQAHGTEPTVPDLVAAGESDEVAPAEAPLPVDASEPDTSRVASDVPAVAYHPRTHRLPRIRSKRVAWRARAVHPPLAEPATVAPLEPEFGPVAPAAPQPVLPPEPEFPVKAVESEQPPGPVETEQQVEPVLLVEPVETHEPPERPSRRRGSRSARSPDATSTSPAEEPSAAHRVPAEPEAPGAAEPPSSPEPPAAAEPPSAGEPLPAPIESPTDEAAELPGGWRLIAGEPAEYGPLPLPEGPTDAAAWRLTRSRPSTPAAAPATAPRSAGLPLGVVHRIAAESQHRIAAAWAPQMAARNHRAPQVHGCVNCSLPLSATARFCRRCGSPQP